MPARSLTLLLALSALGLTVPAAHAAYLGPAPAICVSAVSPDCLVKGGGGDTTVSPRLVQVGDKFTVTLTANEGYGGPGSWSLPSIGAIGAGSTAGYKLVKPGCVGKKTHKQGDQWTADEGLDGKFVCHYKATKTGRGWQKATYSFNVRYGGLASYSEDTFRVVGDNSSYVEGYVRGLPRAKGQKGPGIANMRMKAAGPDGGSAHTNADGYYTIEIKEPGKYEISGEKRASDRKARPRPEFEPGFRKLKIPPRDRIVDVNFLFTRGDAFDIAYLNGTAKTTSAAADGITPITAQITAVDPNGKPLANRPLQVVVNGARLTPRAILCQDGVRIWPGALTGGTRSAQVDPTHAITTNASGQVSLTLYPGTEPGSLELTVRNAGKQAKDSPEGSEALKLNREDGPELAAIVKDAARIGVPGRGTPVEGSVSVDPASANNDIVRWLNAAKAAGLLRGWDFAPVHQGGAGLAKYGVAFWRSGSPPSIARSLGDDVLVTGSVFNTDFHGINPLRDGAPLEDLAAWSQGRPTVVHRLQGDAGNDLTYLGFPYELGPALACWRSGP